MGPLTTHVVCLQTGNITIASKEDGVSALFPALSEMFFPSLSSRAACTQTTRGLCDQMLCVEKCFTPDEEESLGAAAASGESCLLRTRRKVNTKII